MLCPWRCRDDKREINMGRFKEVYSYREMVAILVKRDLKARYKGSVLGFLWTLINPLFQMIIYTLVFSYIMRSGIEDYYLFLFVALVPWIFFSSSIHAGAGCIWSQKGMINKIYFPREVLPIAHVIGQLVNMLLSFIVIFFVLAITGKPLNIRALLLLPVIIFLEFLIALGITFITSGLSVFFQDLMQIMGILVMLWQFLSPVMYSVDSVSEHMKPFLYLNPMTPVIEAYRDILYYAKLPAAASLLNAAVLGAILLMIGWVLFGKLEKKFSEVL